MTTMAEGAVLQAFIQVVFEKLSAAAVNELGFFRTTRGVQKELSSLSSTLSSIRALVEDAEEKQLTDKVIRLWVLKLKDVAYEIDELLDDYASRNPKSKLQQPKFSHWTEVWKHLRYYICLSNGLFKHEIVVQIRKINLKLDKLAKERDSLGLQMFVGINRLEITERPKTGSLVDNSSVFGREDDKENIINFVLARDGFITVLSIVGMGGLGKTTLAQLVYNDARIKEHFEVRIWVCVSENFDVAKLTKEAIESVSITNLSTNTNANYFSSGHSFTTTNINLLQEDLCNKLKRKKFLLVLDDVWNEDSNKWESYYRALAVGKRGSTIIVTTRNESVGLMMRAVRSYKLKQLSDEDCWRLFKNYAFEDGDSSSYPSLEKMGKEIVRKLKGLPLAAKTLGSLLYSKVDEKEWRSIAKSEIWELPSDRNNILPALRLSYTHLPPHLKQCFAFCSIFHKDYEFEKDKLVYIWIALGFIKPQSRRRLEDVANGYFDDLLGRSFFQNHKGRFVMHDAIHDLAQSVSADECHRLEENARVVVTPERIRHTSFSCENSKPTSFQAFFPFEKMRTLLLLRGHKSSTEPLPTELFLKLKYIRVLDLNRRDISALPDSIGNLKQLRYLNLSGTRISSLPSTITKLHNLQTLRLKNCDALDNLPEGITRLVNLRHLEASVRLVSTIAGIGSFTSLQELDEFVVHQKKGYHIQELGTMAELTGSLSIRDLENVTSMAEASAARLNDKQHLTALHLIWSQDRRIIFNETTENQVLEFLRPNDHVNEITIKGFMGSKFPSWLHNLSFIQTIHLSDCKHSKSLPSLGKLRMLKYLDIGGFDSVAHISDEFLGNGNEGRFEALRELVLQDMSNLEDWVSYENDKDLPCLNELQLLQCPKLQHLPQIPPNLIRIRVSESGFTVLPQIHTSSLMLKPSLTSLQIHDCPNLMSLQKGLLDQELKFLKELTITDCEELVHVPANGFLNFASLKILHIYNCPKLVSTREGALLLPPFLEDLRITECDKIINSIIQKISHVSSLMHLSIKECKDLILFPEEGLPLGLRTLEIFNCENLISLPDYLRELQSLTTLIIVNCPRIPCLPPSGLPEVLQELHIQDCPLLMESCREYGIDGKKIAHVPNVDITDVL